MTAVLLIIFLIICALVFTPPGLLAFTLIAAAGCLSVYLVVWAVGVFVIGFAMSALVSAVLSGILVTGFVRAVLCLFPALQKFRSFLHAAAAGFIAGILICIFCLQNPSHGFQILRRICKITAPTLNNTEYLIADKAEVLINHLIGDACYCICER